MTNSRPPLRAISKASPLAVEVISDDSREKIISGEKTSETFISKVQGRLRSLWSDPDFWEFLSSKPSVDLISERLAKKNLAFVRTPTWKQWYRWAKQFPAEDIAGILLSRFAEFPAQKLSYLAAGSGSLDEKLMGWAQKKRLLELFLEYVASPGWSRKFDLLASFSADELLDLNAAVKQMGNDLHAISRTIEEKRQNELPLPMKLEGPKGHRPIQKSILTCVQREVFIDEFSDGIRGRRTENVPGNVEFFVQRLRGDLRK